MVTASYKAYAKIRDEQRLTDYQVCKATGIDQPTFSAWKAKSENKEGGYIPKLNKLMAIADIIGCTVQDFMVEVDFDDRKNVNP